MRLIESLSSKGFEIGIAFWAKPTDEGKWYLYLASPLYDAKGPATAYRLVHDVLRQKPELWIDPFENKVVGMTDSMATEATRFVNSTIAGIPSNGLNPSRLPRIIEFDGSSLGKVSIDGAYIYTPPTATSST
jgi:hypothetical protein